MAITDLQKKAAQAIVNIFETGKALGDYGRVVYVANDPGQLTYGRSQTTLASGSLFLLIQAYCQAPGALYGAALSPYLPALSRHDPALNTDMALRGLLQSAGSDPVMRATQDAFFDRSYWDPASSAAQGLSLSDPLSVAVVYDSFIQGSWRAMRDRTLATQPQPANDPRGWTRAYVATRRAWMAGNSNPLLQRCVYRMDSLGALMDQGAWALPLSLTVRGVVISAEILTGEDTHPVSAVDPAERLLRLSDPFMTGDDVRAVQTALGITADGIFGPATEQAVRAFQAQHGLAMDGIVGPATRQALGL